ncbi:MAG: hypothetical protein HRU30_10415, partial [Rhodobacteraceae bacterium]|nr:hypothetical protein [Paracoccaceae bacterium]
MTPAELAAKENVAMREAWKAELEHVYANHMDDTAGMTEIAETVSELAGVSVEDILGQSRARKYSI